MCDLNKTTLNGVLGDISSKSRQSGHTGDLGSCTGIAKRNVIFDEVHRDCNIRRVLVSREEERGLHKSRHRAQKTLVDGWRDVNKRTRLTLPSVTAFQISFHSVVRSASNANLSKIIHPVLAASNPTF